jgi:group I intron endonuclease
MAIKMKPKSFLKTNTTHTGTDDKVKDNEMIFNGVYLIENSITGRKYVGSSSNVDRRIKTHKQHLETGCHNNRKLQKDHDMHGIESFKFIILEKDVAHDLLTAYEKYWIYKHDAIVKYKGYNDKMPTLNHSAFKYVYELKENINK